MRPLHDGTTASVKAMKSMQTVSFHSIEENGTWLIEPPVEGVRGGLSVRLEKGGHEFRIAGLTASVSSSGPECLDAS
jgi:hypothetical protein